MSSTVAIMQPYIFPYVGYMSLVDASDTFIFYDDVNFIKKGWINRNQIVLDKKAYKFTLPLSGASQNKQIKDIAAHDLESFLKKFLSQLKASYKNAKYLPSGIDYVESTLTSDSRNIGELAALSVIKFFEHVGIEKEFLRSSENFSSTRGWGKSERLIAITKTLNSSRYVNSIGGTALYSKDEFSRGGVCLDFIQPKVLPYSQCNTERFIAGLSVIDLMMNLPKDEIVRHIRSYEII